MWPTYSLCTTTFNTTVATRTATAAELPKPRAALRLSTRLFY